MENALAEGEALFKYIPQRPPMLLIGALLHYDGTLIRSSYTVEKEGVFVEDEFLREAGIVENIAQTAAAGVGYHYLEQTEKGAIPLGFIASVRNFEVQGLPRTGEKLTTEVRVEQEVMNMTIVEGKVQRDGELLAKGQVRIFLQEE